jgi:hypothetical protein
MPNSFIIEYDTYISKWVTYVWIDGLHDVEDQYLCRGTEDIHDTIEDACDRMNGWKEVERIIEREMRWDAPRAQDVFVEAIAPGAWAVLYADGKRRVVSDHVDALIEGCIEASKSTA